MPLNVARVRECLQNFDFRALFIQELGWDRHPAGLTVAVHGNTYSLQPVAEKRGFQVFECSCGENGRVPDHPTRSKIERQVAKSAHEHIIIYTDAAKTVQKWQWVRRELGRPLARREYDFFKGHTGELLAQKLQYLAIELDEEEQLSLVDVTRRVKRAFDVDRVTRRFYDRFKAEHASLSQVHQGDHVGPLTAEWYASAHAEPADVRVLHPEEGLSRRRSRTTSAIASSDGPPEERARTSSTPSTATFCCGSFHEGLGQSTCSAQSSIPRQSCSATVPLPQRWPVFDVHELERTVHGRHSTFPTTPSKDVCSISSTPYQWHLDERPLRADNEINPDVLGYIFEKYVNQKQMGAYYTKEDITGYIARNTIIPFLFDAAEEEVRHRLQARFSALWRLLRDDPDRYIYPAVKHGVIRTLPSPSGRGAGGEAEIVPESELPDFVQKGHARPQGPHVRQALQPPAGSGRRPDPPRHRNLARVRLPPRPLPGNPRKTSARARCTTSTT
ncbi:MAG: hypothetical protein KatS3mg082_2554 [Nitrospiraceae bacterium]|nr:MAG: hypothetical protein KatS3mg082_2554 [Nitrospiraceae bacterium]